MFYRRENILRPRHNRGRKEFPQYKNEFRIPFVHIINWKKVKIMDLQFRRLEVKELDIKFLT